MSTNCGRVTVTGLPANTSVKVCSHGTTTAVDLYSTRTGTGAVTNPVITDTLGHVSFFAVTSQDVDLIFDQSGMQTRLTFTVWPDPHNSWPG